MIYRECPHCGGQSIKGDYDYVNRVHQFVIHCNGCNSKFMCGKGREYTIELWNKRLDK